VRRSKTQNIKATSPEFKTSSPHHLEVQCEGFMQRARCREQDAEIVHHNPSPPEPAAKNMCKLEKHHVSEVVGSPQADQHLCCCAGNLARMFTTLVLTKDALLLLANAVQGCLNSALLYQTAMTAVRRRAVRRQKALDTADFYHKPGDDEEVRTHVLPFLVVRLSGRQIYTVAAHRVEPAGLDIAELDEPGGQRGEGMGAADLACLFCQKSQHYFANEALEAAKYVEPGKEEEVRARRLEPSVSSVTVTCLYMWKSWRRERQAAAQVAPMSRLRKSGRETGWILHAAG